MEEVMAGSLGFAAPFGNTPALTRLFEKMNKHDAPTLLHFV
jgi:hypothetical protein